MIINKKMLISQPHLVANHICGKWLRDMCVIS